MDTSLLVKEAAALTKALDAAGFLTSFVMWVHSSDTDIWRLWIAPAKVTDIREAYRSIADVISKNKAEIPGIDVGSIEVIPSDHPAVAGLSKIMSFRLGEAHFSGNTFNGYYLPDGIIVRVDRSIK